LVASGLVEYRVEVTAVRSRSRLFRAWKNWSIPEVSCFIRTERGVAEAAHNTDPLAFPIPHS
jgi:hypothetical protein